MRRLVRAATSFAALIAATWVPPDASAAETPRTLYMLHCQGCHLPDGSGSPGAVPTLEGMARFLLLPEGRAYLVQVPGSAQSSLSDADLARVLNWMLQRFGPRSVAQGEPPYTEEEVRLLRPQRLPDVEAARRELLRALESIALYQSSGRVSGQDQASPASASSPLSASEYSEPSPTSSSSSQGGL